MNILRSILLAVLLSFVINPIFSQTSLNILILGSTESIEEGYTAYDPTSIATQLNSILIGDADYTGTTINVQFNDIYRSDNGIDVSYGSAPAVSPFTHKRFSLVTYCNYPSDKVDNISDLKGALTHDWDYVIIIGDPYIVSVLPGYYALGVNKVLDYIDQGDAEAFLLMQWPDKLSSYSIDHFEEITYRIGEGAGSDLTVIPAGLAWNSLSSGLIDTAGTSNHPSPNGAYLAAATIYSSLFSKDASASTYTYNDQIATHAYQTVQTEINNEHYSGIFNYESPFSACNIITNSLDYLETGSSTENGFEVGFRDVIEEEQLYTTQASYDFNYGRANYYFEPSKRYKVDANLYPYSLGFPMQDHSNSGDSTTFYGIDYRADAGETGIDNGTDLGVARYMINVDQASHLRAIPVRTITAQLLDKDPTKQIYGDAWHLSGSVNRAVGSYMFSLLTGKCGLEAGVESSPSAETYHVEMKVGYETAWTIMHLKGKAPGFKVVRADINDTIINSAESTSLKIRFLNPPTDTVRVSLRSDNESAVDYSLDELIFTPTNYSVEQTVDLVSLPGSVTNDRAKIYFDVTSKDIFFNDFYDVWDYAVQRELVSGLIEEPVSNNTINIFPNPAHNRISISGVQVSSGSILSSDGSVVSQFKTNSVDISHLSSGIYFIKVGVTTAKFVKW